MKARGPRGIVRRGKTDAYVGVPSAVQKPSPKFGVGVSPVALIPHTKDLLSALAAIEQIGKLSADGLAFLAAVINGSLSAKSVVIDATGGSSTVGAPGGLSASGDGVFGGNLGIGGVLTIGNIVQARMVAAAVINAGTSLLASIGLDGVTPFTHGGTGSYTLKLAAAVPDQTKLLCLATIATIHGFIEAVPISTNQIAVGTADASNGNVDTTCYVVVFQIQ